MSEDLSQNPEQSEEQEQEAVDPIVLLGQELQQIREALGLGESPTSSSLMQRLSSIESRLTQPERERNLPKQITHSQLRNANWMRRHGVQLEDIGTCIEVIKDPD
jgi:hypothetical protein